MVVMDNLVTILFIVNILLSIIIIFRERRQTAQTWAWLLVLMFIPIVGFVLYFFFGRGISKEKIFDMRSQAKVGLNVELEEQKQALRSSAVSASADRAGRSAAAGLPVDSLWAIPVYDSE